MEYAARALFPKGKEPRYAFEVFVKMIPEAVMRFTNDGIGLRALDPSKTALLELQFSYTGLEDYELRQETSVGLLFTTMKDVVKRIGATDKLELAVDEARFHFFVYPKKGKEAGISRRFSFPIVRLAEEEVPQLDLDFSATLEMDSSVLDDVLDMVAGVTDAVQISVGDDRVSFRGVGEGGKAAEAEFTRDDEAVFELASQGTAAARYSVDTLADINGKLKSLSKRVRLELSPQKPLRLTYEFATGTFSAVVAPRTD